MLSNRIWAELSKQAHSWRGSNAGACRFSTHHDFLPFDSWHGTNRSRAMKNFHLPLPEHTYTQLRAEAERMQVSTATLAREAIDSWLKQQFRKARHEAIAAYAAEMAGTDFDLDSDLELAAMDLD
jgi:hypothetical protein